MGIWFTGILTISAAALWAKGAGAHALLLMLAVVAVSRVSFPELTRPVTEGEPLEPQRIHWGMLILGLAAGWFGAEAWSAVPRWGEGAVLQAFSLFFFLNAFPSRSRVLSTACPSSSPATPAFGSGIPATPLLVWIFFLGGAFLLVRSVVLFRTGALQPGLNTLYSALALCFVAVALRRQTREINREDRVPIALWVILVAASLMRFPFLGKDFTGFQIDEANHLIDGIRVLKGELYSPFITGWWGNPSFVYYITAGFFKVFGISLETGRALSATLSVISLYLFYRLARFYVAPAASLIATLLFSFAWYHLYYSLSPFTDIFTLTFELAAFFFLERGLREGRRADFMWTGLFLAACVMSYISGRLAVIMVFVSLLGRLILYGKPFFKAYARSLTLTLMSFLWLIGPFLYFVKKSPEEFMGRSKELSIFAEIQRTGDYWFPVKTFVGTLMSFVRNADPDPRFGLYHVPSVDPVTVIFLVLGLMVTLLRPRFWLTWVILPGLFFSVIANSMAIQGLNPSPWYMNMQRFYLVLPFAFLLVASGLEWFLDRVAGSGPVIRSLMRSLLIVVLAVSAFLNGHIYYYQFTHTPSTWDSMAFSHQQATRICIEKFPSYHILADWEIFSSVGDFMTYGTPVKVVRVNSELKIPLRGKATRDVLFVFIPYKNQEIQALVRQHYPGAEWKDVLNTHGRPSLSLAFIKREEVEKVQAGSTEGPDLP